MAFEQLKKEIADATLLFHPDFEAPFHLYTDACKVAGGGGLFQVDENAPEEVKEGADPEPKHLRPIAFHARKWSPVQRRYATLEQEVLAVLDCLEHFKYFTAFAPWLIVHTDAKSILFLLSFNYHSDNQKQMRYSIKLMSLPQMEILHCPGSKNALADALSRQWCEPPKPPVRRAAKHMKKEEIEWNLTKGEKFTLDDLITTIEKDPLVVSHLTTVTPEFLQEIKENDSETPANNTAVKRCSRISTFFRKFTTEYVAEAQAQDPYCRKISAKLAQLPDHQDASFRFHHGLLLRKKRPRCSVGGGQLRHRCPSRPLLPRFGLLPLPRPPRREAAPQAAQHLLLVPKGQDVVH